MVLNLEPEFVAARVRKANIGVAASGGSIGVLAGIHHQLADQDANARGEVSRDEARNCRNSSQSCFNDVACFRVRGASTLGRQKRVKELEAVRDAVVHLALG